MRDNLNGMSRERERVIRENTKTKLELNETTCGLGKLLQGDLFSFQDKLGHGGQFLGSHVYKLFAVYNASHATRINKLFHSLAYLIGWSLILFC